MDETIARLQDELSRLQGPARARVLAQLGEALTMDYARAGDGVPRTTDQLSAAIEFTNEAYLLTDHADPVRGRLGRQLGSLLSMRHAMKAGDGTDRDVAIALLTEMSSLPEPPAAEAISRLALGQLYLDRTLETFIGAVAQGNLGLLSPDLSSDAEVAAGYFREVLQSSAISTKLLSVVRTQLDLLESLRPLFSGDLTDISKLGEAMAGMQRLMQPGVIFGSAGSNSLNPLTLLADLGQRNVLDFFAVDLKGEPGNVSAVPPRRPVAIPQSPVDPESSRRATRDRLTALVDGRPAPVWEQARLLLQGGPDRVSAGELDAYISAAANAVDAGEDGDPVESGLDHLLSAVGLCLREQRDGSGWGEELVAASSASKPLLRAAALVPPEHPAAAVVVETLGGLLGQTRPLAGVAAEVAVPLGGYAAAVSPGTSTVAAFDHLCRVVSAVVADADLDPGALAGAVGKLPADSPWRGVLATAVGQARLLAAVRSGAAVAVDPDPDGLAPLLAALLADDLQALRAALDTLAGTDRTPPAAAIVGAGHLELAIRAPMPERDDLAAAIRLLAAAPGLLADSHERLRTRTWGRLAEAYRRRGAPGDDESSRQAGLAALSGGGLDARSAARFAGWMLADGHANEAYTALEIVAAGAGRPKPASRPLIEDVVNVIVGIAPPAVRPVDVPDWSEVAAAVRKAGASALLYLHPTDDAGRTAGVLCLDPGTGRLDVIANVPVTDPLTSDDPGWAAIVGRWRGGLLVAATGELRRLALPAVCAGNGRRLAQDVSVGYLSSGAQLIELTGRPAVPVWKTPLFVVNPRGDRDAEMADVLVLRRLFYPRSACIGRALEAVDGSGTPDDLLRRLPGASLVHLGCGLRGTEVELAGEQAFDLAAAPGSGIVILTESGVEGFGPTAERLLRAGYSGVIGWHRPVPVSFAALALFMTHLMLVDHRLPASAAVAAVQRWMLDPDRELPPLLPGVHQHTVDTLDLTRPALWAALAYHGC